MYAWQWQNLIFNLLKMYKRGRPLKFHETRNAFEIVSKEIYFNWNPIEELALSENTTLEIYVIFFRGNFNCNDVPATHQGHVLSVPRELAVEDEVNPGVVHLPGILQRGHVEAVLYCIVLYCTLYCAVLYCTVPAARTCSGCTWTRPVSGSPLSAIQTSSAPRGTRVWNVNVIMLYRNNWIGKV